VRRFHAETGLRESDWKPFWPRFNDALREAGFAPNQITQGYGKAKLLESYANLALEIGNLPTRNDLQFKAHNDPGFPTSKTFERLGTKEDIANQVLAYCQGRAGFEPLLTLCRECIAREKDTPAEPEPNETGDGYVYLAKAGQFYKIGKTNAPGRREYELGIQLPEKLTIVHRLRTDDPDGIEAYWHRRFASKRKNGEWFALSGVDISAFKRRKGFM
jgi:hypothetical protein